MCLLGVAQAAGFRATLEPATIREGEAANLLLIFEDGQPDQRPALPEVPHLSFAAIGSESRFQFVNGRQSTTTVYRYVVMAAAAGTYTIPAITVSVGGRRLESAPLRLTVLAANAPGRGAAPGGSAREAPRAFLEIAVPHTNVFVGEVLPVDLVVYAINPRQFELGQLPAEGFTVGKQERLEPARTLVNGVFYTRGGTRTTVVPTRAGPLTLGPLQGRVEVLVPVNRPRGGLFDEFFNDPFFNRMSEPAVVSVAAEAVTIQVQPLPVTNVPPSFTGAVGEFRLDATAAPTNVAVGEPVRLRVQISGRGALAGLTLPPLDGWTDFRVYPAQNRVEYTDTLGIEGTKVLEYDLLPQNAEVRAVPPVVFSFFDPVNQAYITLTNPPLPLLVRPVGGRTPVLAATADAPPTREIVHLKPRLGPVAVVSPPWVARPGFWFAALAPAAGWLAVLGWRQRRERLAANPRLVRRRAVSRQIRRGLAELEQRAAAADAAGFFALAFRLLQEQLGERLDQPAASITEAVVDERLRPRGVPEPLLAALHQLFQECNQARYAPTGSAQDLRAVAGRLRRALEELRQLDLA